MSNGLMIKRKSSKKTSEPVFVYHENASGEASFTRTGDAFAVDQSLTIFAVADSPLRYLVRELKRYPYDDHGLEAAETFVETFLSESRRCIQEKQVSGKSVGQVLLRCNQNIRSLNSALNKSYDDKLNYDLAETVGVGAFIFDGKLYYGGLEDCYVNVLRGSRLENIAPFTYQIMKAAKYVESISSTDEVICYVPLKLKRKLKRDSFWESCWCNYLRNNRGATDKNGEMVGWGCFTGETGAVPFFQSHVLDLKRGDIILLFSDGMIPLLNDDTFLAWFLKNRSCTFSFQYEMRKKVMKMFKENSSGKKEKTVICYEY